LCIIVLSEAIEKLIPFSLATSFATFTAVNDALKLNFSLDRFLA